MKFLAFALTFLGSSCHLLDKKLDENRMHLVWKFTPDVPKCHYISVYMTNSKGPYYQQYYCSSVYLSSLLWTLYLIQPTIQKSDICILTWVYVILLTCHDVFLHMINSCLVSSENPFVESFIRESWLRLPLILEFR